MESNLSSKSDVVNFCDDDRQTIEIDIQIPIKSNDNVGVTLVR